MATDGNYEFKPGPAATSVISLSQAILAPLDAISKAQVHAARSFLNFVLQIAFPHESSSKSPQTSGSEDQMYLQTFRIKNGEGEGVVSIPSLALVPVQPLTIERAQYDLELVIEGLDYHRQIQASENNVLKQEAGNDKALEKGQPHAPRQWYLVSDPISVRGTLSDPGIQENRTSRKATIKVHVEIGRANVPSGLEKILSSATQLASATNTETHSSSDVQTTHSDT